MRIVHKCEHNPFDVCAECEPTATRTAAKRTLPTRSDGVVLFREDTTYHVIVGGMFGEGELFEQLQDALARDGITVDKHLDNPRAYGARTRQVGALVLYAVYEPEEPGPHRMEASGFHGLELGGARGNVAADVSYRDGKIVFDPPSAWDELSDKEHKVLYCLEEAGKWVSPPELARAVHAEYGKRGFSEKVVRRTLAALVKLGEAEGPVRRKYRYVAME